MKAFKKQIPILFYAILLITVAALCIVIANGSTAEAASNTPTDNNVSAPSENIKNVPDNSQDSSPVPSIEQPTSDPPATLVYNDTVPRSSKASSEFLYTQNIYGNKSVHAKAAYQTTIGSYVIATTDSSEGDICGTTPISGVIKLDSSGNILSAYSLPYSYAEKYIASQITPLGIVIITAPADNKSFYVNIITYSLDEHTVYKISSANTAKIIANDTSFLIFCEYEEECLVYSYNSNGFTFQSIKAGHIVELFDFYNYYLIFTNNAVENSYTITKLNAQTLSTTSQSTTVNSELLSVIPINENGKQNFIIIQKNNNTITAEKFDSTLSRKIAEKKLGKFNVAGVICAEDAILIVCNGNINGIVRLSFDLTANYHESQNTFLSKTCLDSIYIKNCLYYLVTDENNKLALVCNNGKTDTIRYFDVETTSAMLLYNSNNTLTLIFQNSSKIEIIGLAP